MLSLGKLFGLLAGKRAEEEQEAQAVVEVEEPPSLEDLRELCSGPLAGEEVEAAIQELLNQPTETLVDLRHKAERHLQLEAGYSNLWDFPTVESATATHRTRVLAAACQRLLNERTDEEEAEQLERVRLQEGSWELERGTKEIYQRERQRRLGRGF